MSSMTNTVLATEAQVTARIDELAQTIIADFPDEKPLFIALLRGAAPFASKLLFSIARQAPDFHPEMDYMTISTYGVGKEAGEPRIIADLSPSTVVKGRTIIMLDDVLDKGITTHFVREHLRASGASDVRLIVLASKQTERLRVITADYCGFELDDVWLVGMGMDNADSGKEHSRWLGSIEAIVHE